MRERMKRIRIVVIWLLLGMAFKGFWLIKPQIAYGMEDQADEAYTDTSQARGILALRCEVFKGFHGAITVQCLDLTRNQEEACCLDEESGYVRNLLLRPGEYELALEAVSENRHFLCRIRDQKIRIQEGKVSIAEIRVLPSSRTILPEQIEPATVSQAGRNERRTEPDGADSGRLLGPDGEERGTEADERLGIYQLVKATAFIGLLLFSALAAWILKRKKEGETDGFGRPY